MSLYRRIQLILFYQTGERGSQHIYNILDQNSRTKHSKTCHAFEKQLNSDPATVAGIACRPSLLSAVYADFVSQSLHCVFARDLSRTGGGGCSQGGENLAPQITSLGHVAT